MVFDGDYENIQLDRVGQGDGVGPRAFSGQKIAHFPFSSTSVMEGSLNCLGWVPRTMKHILALGATNGKVAFLQGRTGRRLCEMQAHNSAISSINFSNSSDLCLLGTSSGPLISKINLYDVDEKRTAHCIQKIEYQGGNVADCNFILGSEDRFLATSGNCIQLWDVESCSIISEFSGHSARVNSLIVEEDHFISCSQDSSIKIFDIRSATVASTSFIHRASVNSIVISDCGTMLISGCEDGSVSVSDMRRPTEAVLTFSCLRPIKSVAISPKSHFVLAGTADGETKTLGLCSGRLLGPLDESLKSGIGAVSCLRYSPDGRFIGIAYAGGDSAIWAPPSPKSTII